MNDIKVSVIIPVYNTEKYLRECLDSVIGQTLKEIEIICIDDGSTDHSRAILEEYRDRDSRIKLLFQEHSNAGAARNKGLEIARGKYLSILDSDDLFDPIMLEEAYEIGSNNQADIVMFRHNRFDDQSKKRFDLPHMMAKKLFPAMSAFAVEDIPGNFYYSIYGWTWDKLFLRSFIEKEQIKFQSIPVHNDMYFTYSALAMARRIAYDENALMCQRVNRSGAISRSKENWDCIIEALSATKFFLETHHKYDTLKKEFTTYALHMLVFTFNRVSERSRAEMQYVCNYYGFPVLGIDLADEAGFVTPNDREIALKDFVLPVYATGAGTGRNECGNAELAQENKALKEEIRSIHQSATYKIGRFITWLPRKARGGIRCCQEHGLRYTLRRVKEKFLRLIGAAS